MAFEVVFKRFKAFFGRVEASGRSAGPRISRAAAPRCSARPRRRRETRRCGRSGSGCLSEKKIRPKVIKRHVKRDKIT